MGVAEIAPRLPIVNMKVLEHEAEEVNVNKALLPQLLPRFLYKLHLTEVFLGLGIIIVSIIGTTTVTIFAPLLIVGFTAACAGIFGSLANRFKSLVLHGGSVCVYGLSIFMSFIGLVTSIGILYFSYRHQEADRIMRICIPMLVLLGKSMVASVLNFGVEIMTIYVADCQRRLAIEDKRREASVPEKNMAFR